MVHITYVASQCPNKNAHTHTRPSCTHSLGMVPVIKEKILALRVCYTYKFRYEYTAAIDTIISWNGSNMYQMCVVVSDINIYYQLLYQVTVQFRTSGTHTRFCSVSGLRGIHTRFKADTEKPKHIPVLLLFCRNRGSYMSAHVLLNLFYELGKR